MFTALKIQSNVTWVQHDEKCPKSNFQRAKPVKITFDTILSLSHNLRDLSGNKQTNFSETIPQLVDEQYRQGVNIESQLPTGFSVVTAMSFRANTEIISP